MNAKELVIKSPVELERLALELRGQLRDLRFKVATRQHTKVHALSALRKDLARVETVLRTKRTPS